MKNTKKSNKFRLIAIRPLSDCDGRYRKILKPNQFYLFYNDYCVVSENQQASRVEKKKKEELIITTVPSGFFNVNNTQLDISTSAVIGKNGDGKSSLVELAIRILNNFAYATGFYKKQNTLKPINKLRAELYYEIDNKLISIKMDGNEIIWEIPNKDDIILFLDSPEENIAKIDNKLLSQYFFYTQISNYSLYAYNSNELVGESEGDWIDGIFHKNDGYQTPVVLNPMRTNGEIDINRENVLTKDRLISLFLTNDDSKNSFRRINEKQLAKYFQVRLSNKSKLKEKTLLDFFLNYKKHDRTDYLENNEISNDSIVSYISNLNSFIYLITQSKEKDPDTNFNNIEEQINSFITPLLFLHNILVRRRKYHKYLKIGKGLLETRYKGKPSTSVSEYLDTLGNLFEAIENNFSTKEINIKVLNRIRSVEKKINDLRGISIFEFIHIQRIITCAICEDIWKMKLRKVELPINHSSLLFDYIIYKSLSIISKYPNYVEYRNGIFKEINQWNDNKEIEKLRKLIKQAIEKIWKDVKTEKTHITLKIRQCINFLCEHPYKEENYFIGGEKFIDISTFYNRTIKLSKNTPNQLYDYFFPPIFETNVVLQQVDNNYVSDYIIDSELFEDINVEQSDKLTLLSHLSSGERQQLNITSSVLYHLRNINSVSSRDKMLIRYNYVLLIFEEIELYFHPEYQRTFLKFLLDHISKAKLKLKGVDLCFITHSPFILSDIPKQNILTLEKGEQIPVPFETLGANIHEMLGHNFLLSSTIGEIVKDKIDDFLEVYSEFKNKGGNDPVFAENKTNYHFLINNLGEGYLKNILRGYYDEMMTIEKNTIEELIFQKKMEIKELEEKKRIIKS